MDAILKLAIESPPFINDYDWLKISALASTTIALFRSLFFWPILEFRIRIAAIMVSVKIFGSN